jgi:uncharacterized protein YkwD
MRAAVVCLINEERRRFHLPPLRQNRKLDGAAQAHTDDMVSRNYFSHYSRGGRPPWGRTDAAGYPGSYIGENLATGVFTPAGLMALWMSDIGHCQNILWPEFADVGIGVSPHGIPRYTSGPTWTADFGLRTGHRAPSRNMKPSNGCPFRL